MAETQNAGVPKTPAHEIDNNSISDSNTSFGKSKEVNQNNSSTSPILPQSNESSVIELQPIQVLQKFYDSLKLTNQVFEAAYKCKTQSNLKEHYKKLRDFCKSHKTQLGMNISEFDEKVTNAGNRLLQDQVKSMGKLTLPEPYQDVPYKIPSGYKVNVNGIYGMVNNEFKLICRSAIFITQDIEHHKDLTCKSQLYVFTKGKGWKRLDFIDNTILSNANLLSMNLSSKISGINSNNSAQVVRYLDNFRGANFDTIQQVKSTDKVGWVDEHFITPYNQSVYVFDAPEHGFANVLTLKGSLEKWLEVAQSAFNYSPVARFILSAYFVPPLLQPLNERLFCVYLWGKSTYKKSTIFTLGNSVWGTEGMMTSFSGTLSGFEGEAAERSGFPLSIDDKQQARSSLDTSKFIMKLTNGRGDGRAKKDGTPRIRKVWKTIAFTNGEEPLIETTATNGVHTRTISLHVESEILPTTISNQIWNEINNQNCGWAGKMFIEYLEKTDIHDIRIEHNKAYDILRQEFPEHHEEHILYVSLVSVVEQIINQLFFHSDIQPFQTAREILSMLEIKSELSNSTMIWEHLVSWLSRDGEYFKKPGLSCYTACYGEYKRSYLAINKECLAREFMNWGNFQVAKVIDDLAQDNYIMTYQDKKQRKPRSTWNSVINGVQNVPSIRIDLKLLPDGTNQEEKFNDLTKSQEI